MMMLTFCCYIAWLWQQNLKEKERNCSSIRVIIVSSAHLHNVIRTSCVVYHRCEMALQNRTRIFILHIEKHNQQGMKCQVERVRHKQVRLFVQHLQKILRYYDPIEANKWSVHPLKRCRQGPDGLYAHNLLVASILGTWFIHYAGRQGGEIDVSSKKQKTGVYKRNECQGYMTRN